MAVAVSPSSMSTDDGELVAQVAQESGAQDPVKTCRSTPEIPEPAATPTRAEPEPPSRENTVTYSPCVSRQTPIKSPDIAAKPDSKWSEGRFYGQTSQDGSPCSRSVDLSVAVLGGLPAVPPHDRATECARRRGRIRTAIAFLDKVLEESAEALKMKPSKRDRLTAANYHACYRHLNWSLGRCQQMQELAEMLENYDSGRFSQHSISSDYAQLSVDICTRHDRALSLLCDLCKDDVEDDMDTVEKTHGVFTDWINCAAATCGGGRTCMRDVSCTGGVNSRKIPDEPG